MNIITNKRSPEVQDQNRNTKKRKKELSRILNFPEIFARQKRLNPYSRTIPAFSIPGLSIHDQPKVNIDSLSSEINQKLIEIAAMTFRLDFNKLSPELNWKVFKTIFGEVMTEQEKIYIKNCSFYKETVKNIAKAILDETGYKTEQEYFIYQRYFETVRRQYMQLSENIVRAEIFLPITPHLYKIQKQLSHLKLQNLPGNNPEDDTDHTLGHQNNLEFLCGCTNLNSLELCHLDLSTEEAFQNIEAVFQMANLEKLVVTDPNNKFNPLFFHKISASTSIREIELNGIHITQNEMKIITSIPSLKKLKLGLLSRVDISGIEILARSSFITNLELDINPEYATIWWHQIQEMPSLERLNINHLTHFFINTSSPFPQLKHLTVKNVSLYTSNQSPFQNFCIVNSLETIEVHRQLTDLELSFFPTTLKTLRCLEGSKFSDLALAAFNDLTIEKLSSEAYL